MSQRYQVKGKIAEGGLGEVYLATDTQLDRDVALKRVRPPDEEGAAAALEQDLLREARTLSALQHPNIVTIYDVGRDEKGPFVVMEYLNGETLDDVISRGALTVEDFTEVVVQSLEGMIAAQTLGLVHRDLKPGNLMVVWLASGKFQVKILDFGLAKFSRIATRQTEDQGSAIMGSIFFMAPEQFERLPLDGRTDLYSLGCIYYQVLTTLHPFGGETGRDVMVSHLQHHVRNLAEARPDVPKWMADWVMWLISREMESRPPDAQTALDYFRAAQAGAARTRAKTQSVPPVRIVGRGTGPGGVTAPAAHPSSASPAGARKSPGKTMKKPVKTKRTTSSRSSSSGGGGKWILILLLLGLTAGGAYWYVQDQKKKAALVDQGAALDTLAAQKKPAGTPESLEIVFAAIRRGGGEAKLGLEILKKMEGDQVAAAVARELEKTSGSGEDRLILMEALAAHSSKGGVEALIKAAETGAGPARTAALDAIGKAAKPEDIPAFLRILPKMQDPVNREKFFKVLEGLQTKLTDPDAAVEQLTGVLSTAPKELRPEILQLLSRTGHPRASTAAIKELEAGGDRRAELLPFLAAWTAPDARLAENVLQIAEAEEDSRATLLPLYLELASRVTAWTAAEVVQHLRDVQAMAVASDKSLETLARVLETTPGPEAQAYIEELSKSEDERLSGIGARAAGAQPIVQERLVTLTTGETTLEAAKATVHAQGKDAYFNATGNYVTAWRQASTQVTWDVEVPDSGQAEVTVFQSTEQPPPDDKTQSAGRFRVRLASGSTEAPVKFTNSPSSFLQVEAGKFTIPRPGVWRLWLEPVNMPAGQSLMNVQKITVRLQ